MTIAVMYTIFIGFVLFKLATPLQTREEGKHFEARKSLRNFDLNTQDVALLLLNQLELNSTA